MPGWLVLAVVVAALTALAFLGRRFAPRETVIEDGRQVGGGRVGDPWLTRFCWVMVGLTLLLVLVSSWNPVGTRKEGIRTSFGKVTGHLSNGPHFTWPWEKVHQMDAAIQTDSFVGDHNCIFVRLANQQTGCADISFQWRIQPGAAEELYKDFRSFDHVRDALVTRRLTAAVNKAFAHFNPLDAIIDATHSSIPASGLSKETLAAFATVTSEEMKKIVGQRIKVLSTIIPAVRFDDATQSRINQLQQQVALTRIATQSQATNKAQAKANAALAQSVNTSPNVLVSRCLDTLEAMVKDHDPVPAGFSCWPGGGVSAVIANPAGK